MASTYTSKLHLEKPDGDDDISVLGINNNMDVIDQKLAGYTYGTRITYGSYSYIDYWKIGLFVCVAVTYKVEDGAIPAWESKIIGTLPSGYRPVSTAQVRGMVDRTQDDGILIAVQSNGTVSISGRATGFTQTSDVAQAYICFPVQA